MICKRLEEEIKAAIAEADRILEKHMSRTDKEEKKKTLIIMEDDVLAIHKLQNRLQDHCNLKIFRRPEDALGTLQTLSVDAAILNMELLDGCGFKVLRQLKNANPDLPILVHAGTLGDHLEGEIKQAVTAGHGEKEVGGIEVLDDFTKTASEVYQDFKKNIIQNLIEDFKRRTHCRYSTIFNQSEDRLLSWTEIISMSFRDLVKADCLMPFCRISNDLTRIRKDESKAMCPFHSDVDPVEGPKRYNTGRFSSYRCGYYEYATLGKIEKRILRILEKRKNENGIRPRRVAGILSKELGETVHRKKPFPELESQPPISLSELPSLESTKVCS